MGAVAVAGTSCCSNLIRNRPGYERFIGPKRHVISSCRLDWKSRFHGEGMISGQFLGIGAHESEHLSFALTVRAQDGAFRGGSSSLRLGLRATRAPSRGKSLYLAMGSGRGMACRGAAAAVTEIVTLKPFLDKIMLLGTVMYYYVTGVSFLPRFPELSDPGSRISSPSDSQRVRKPVKEKPASREQKPRSQVSNEDAWIGVQRKLSESLSQLDNEGTEVEEQDVSSPMLSLQALARGPRQYLLYATLQNLRKEVENIAELEKNLTPLQWRDLSLGVIHLAVLPVCKDWVSMDITLVSLSTDASGRVQLTRSRKANHRQIHTHESSETLTSTQARVLDSMTEFLKDTMSVSTFIEKSGKADLYADLIYFLRFGSIRTGGCCDYRSFNRFAGKALEDMVVTVAEVVGTLFLDSCSSVASLSPQSDTWQAFLVPSILSTRSLERFRNEVALNGWLNFNFNSVVAMFEDRFDLWTFQRPSIQILDSQQVKNTGAEKYQKMVKLPEASLTRLQLPARRSDELKALKGWRYYYSLYLEFSDVVGPIIKILLSRFGEAISFLLVRLIGRSLGLVYQGIRQSVKWPKVDSSK